MLCVPYKDQYIDNLKPVTVLKLFNYLMFCFNNGVQSFAHVPGDTEDFLCAKLPSRCRGHSCEDVWRVS